MKTSTNVVSVVTEDMSTSPFHRRQSSEHSLMREKVSVEPGFLGEQKDWSPLMQDLDRRLEHVERKITAQQDAKEKGKFLLFITS